MEGLKFLKNSQQLVSILAIVLTIFSTQLVSGQNGTACSAAMLRSFSPCINFISNGGSNNSSPTSDCCRSLKYVMSNGTDCLCLIVTGNVPFRVPINRTLAISLPKACNMAGVPFQCKASPSPNPAPGPANLRPTESPRSSQRPRSPPSPSPEAANVPQPFTPPSGPVADKTPDLSPPPTDSVGDPDTNSGFKPNLIPSAAQSSQRFSVFVLLAACGVMALQFN
ncbi:non-specific lipid transfer protein GPI-anchored 21-like [Lycium ferocissimum]|uniref:non-specific lipid transfer protein GPI-anchored 21-like n=1 Tax=Lycium ferocissimum TaxID=112874 RepID=UPI0028158B07|nr:non-specific lipid transfer protein GPI-anchored 21-like [Lycium ferocissimum]XP_059299004.1 non-specific lipid transfer protein GPI-anchored 21-like [Lycium ferocissimum]XP_059299005.1 non-specific lipid transfer protein GPI-anchored 21-like [Lycium ferocissimum]